MTIYINKLKIEENKIASFYGGGLKWQNVKRKEMLLKNIQKHHIKTVMNLNSLLNFPMVKIQQNLLIVILSKVGKEDPNEEREPK